MDTRIILFLAILLHPGPVAAQWHDAVWLFGYHLSEPYPGFGGSTFDFTAEPPFASGQDRPMNLDITVASVCDSTGILQFYTNGAWIANHDHEMMENGDSLNPGQLTSESYYGGLRVAQSHLVLPQPGHPRTYYLFHERLEYHPVLGLAVNPAYYTAIDMAANGGLGKVTEKNVSVFQDSTHNYGTMTAVKHGNGHDWWVVFPELSENVFYRTLLTPNGVEQADVLALEPTYPSLGSNAFTAFSPDGSLLARYEIAHGLYLYSFDRCTGELEGFPSFVPIPGTTLGGGVAFSPSGRFLYMLSSTFVLQADLWAPDIAASLDTVAVYDGYTDPEFGLSTTFFAMQNGPDGRIYFNTNNGTRFLHVIEYPNKKGDSCRVVQRGVELPTINAFTSPHFPNYRLGPLDGSPCDTLGLDNLPLAGFRHEVDTVNTLLVEFTDNSFYGPMDWLWDFGDGSTSALKDPLHEYADSGSYQVCLTVSNQYGSDIFCRGVAVEGTVTATEEAAAAALQVAVSPNPAGETVRVRLSRALRRPALLVLHGALGREVLRQRWPPGRRSAVVDVSKLPGGVYFGQVRAAGGGGGAFRLAVR